MINIYIYDINLNLAILISSFISLVWREGYNTEGIFQLELFLDDDIRNSISLEYYCGITGHDTLMVIKAIEIEDNRMIINGYPSTHVFSDRVSTTVIKNQNAEDAIRQLFSEMEPYPCFSLGDLAELEETFSATTSDGTLLEYFEKIAQTCDIGFRNVYDKTNKQLLLEVYKGEEKANEKYSTFFGNISDIVYSLTSNEYKNVAVVAGAGSGDDRVTVYVGDTDATGADRREMYVDARNVQPEEDETEEEYEERLIEYGEDKLLEQVSVESIEFEIDDTAELGDEVYCYIPEIGINVKIRVAEIEELYQNHMLKKTATLGTPVILRRY